MLRFVADQVRAWHAATTQGLDIPEQEIPADEHGHKPQAQDFFGQLRGSAKLQHINVAVRDGERQLWGEHPANVAAECQKFIDALRQECEALDLRVPRGRVPDDQDDVFEIAAVVAWAHNEWARIHPVWQRQRPHRTAVGQPIACPLRPAAAVPLAATAGVARRWRRDRGHGRR
jgi:hypothetical protein